MSQQLVNNTVPKVSDTWLASYAALVYTPEHRAADVLAICQQFDESAYIAPPNCMNGLAFAPKGYARILVNNVDGWKQRDELRGRLLFERRAADTRPLVTVLPPPEWSNVLYHPTMTDKAAYVERTAETKPTNVIPFAEELEALEAAAVIEQDAAYEAELEAMYELLPARACIRRDLRPGDDVYIWSRPFPVGGVWTLVGQVLTPTDEDNRVLMRYVSGVPMLFTLDAKYKYAVQRNAYQVAWRDCEYHASHPKAAEHRAAQADFNRKLDALLDKAAPIMELITADVQRRVEDVRFQEVKDMAKGQDAA
jgi:hypothetical protein